MPGMVTDFPIEYWLIKNKIEKNKKVQRIRNEIVKERRRHINKIRKLKE